MGLAFVNAGRLGYQIAPFGGIDGRLSTNPIAFAAPRRGTHPILVDMTTSVVAEGKVRVAINQGKTGPLKGGSSTGTAPPTTNPNDFRGSPAGSDSPNGRCRCPQRLRSQFRRRIFWEGPSERSRGVPPGNAQWSATAYSLLFTILSTLPNLMPTTTKWNP